MSWGKKEKRRKDLRMKTYRSITPSGPKSAAALIQIPPIAVVAKHTATFAWQYNS